MRSAYKALNTQLTEDHATDFIGYLMRTVENALPIKCDPEIRGEIYSALIKCDDFIKDVFRKYVNDYFTFTINKVELISYPLTVDEESYLIKRKIMPHLRSAIHKNFRPLKQQLLNQTIV